MQTTIERPKIWLPGDEQIDRDELFALPPAMRQRVLQGVRGGTGYNQMLNEPIITAINNNTFTGPQDICSSTTQQPFTMPANTLTRGSIIRTTAWGNFSTTGTPTLVMGTYAGTTVLAVNVALTTASGAVTLPWLLQVNHIVQGDGSAGKIVAGPGTLTYGTTLTAVTTIPVPGIALATATVDTTAAQLWTVKATWSASSASNIVMTYGYTVEYLNYTP